MRDQDKDRNQLESISLVKESWRFISIITEKIRF